MLLILAIVAGFMAFIDLCEWKLDNAFRSMCICLLLYMAA